MAGVTSLGASHRTLREEVAAEIHSLILLGELAPGERLVEDRLASELGVSRNPVREAIRLLESTGLVEVVPRRGTYVTSVDVDDLGQLLELRTVIEGYAAELAATRATPDDVAALTAIVTSGLDATERGDVVTAAGAHRSFHQELERVAGNRYITEVAAPLRNRTELVFSLLLDRRRQLTWTEHEAIVAAIGTGDGAGARAAVSAHLHRVRDELRTLQR